MKIKRSQLLKIIKEEVSKEWEGTQVFSPAQLDSLKGRAKLISPRNLVPSEEAIRLIKKHEGFRKRVYDDKVDTERASGPWITSFGWDPMTGEMIPPDPISGRLGGDDFDITSFGDTTRMSKTNGVPTVGYGFALNTASKLRKWSKYLGGQGLAYKPVFGGGEAGPSGESSSTMSEKRDMSEAEADRILKEMLPRYYIPVRNSLDVPITQDQFDALVSRAWNEGPAGKTIKDAIALLNIDMGMAWDEAGRAGRFDEDGKRQRAERKKMLKWKEV